MTNLDYMKFIFALLLFPITVLGQSVRNDFSDSLSYSNGAEIKQAVITYISANLANWKEYEAVEWHIFSIYSKREETFLGIALKTTHDKLYVDSLKYFIVDFIIRKKGATKEQDVEVYSSHVAPDFHVRSLLHLRKDPF